MDILNRLSGFKTYIVVALTALVTLFSTLHGAVAPSQAIIAVLVALSVAFARAGSKTDAIRSAALVVHDIAPLVTTLAPATATFVRAADAISSEVATELQPASAAEIAAISPPASTVIEKGEVDGYPVAALNPAPTHTLAPVIAPSPDLVEAVVAAVIARLSGTSTAAV